MHISKVAVLALAIGGSAHSGVDQVLISTHENDLATKALPLKDAPLSLHQGEPLAISTHAKMDIVHVGEENRKLQPLLAQYVLIAFDSLKCDPLHMREVQVFDATGVNVALLKSATQSSTRSPYEASVAVDGLFNSFSHTGDTANTACGAWWRVDLGKLHEITSIKIFNRIIAGNGRMSDAILSLLNDSNEVVFSESMGDMLDVPEKTFDIGHSWYITFSSLATDFNSGVTENLIMTYDVGHESHSVNTFLYERDCTTLVSSEWVDSPSRTGSGVGQHRVVYTFNKANIGGSAIWNNLASQIEVCHKIQVVYLPSDGPLAGVTVVLAEDTRNVDIVFDLTAAYAVDANLDAAETGEEEGQTKLDNYISAFKCNIADMEPDGSNLSPNTDLVICITTLFPDEVEIQSVDVLKIAQEGGGDIDFVSGGSVVYSSFTSLEYRATDAAVFTARVPRTSYNYGSPNPLRVTGSVGMKLQGSTRMLQTNVGTKLFDTNANSPSNKDKAFFELNVKLQPGVVEQEQGMLNSANDSSSESFAILGLIAASAYMLW